MPPKQAAAPYAVDERVFCFHLDMLYEARVLDVQQVAGVPASADANQRWRYRIHYKGWKNTWDDWVPADRVRKFNDENRELATQLRDQARVLQQQKNAKAKKAASGPPGGPGGPGGASGSGGGGRNSLAAASAGALGGGSGGGSGGGAGTGTATPGERGGRDHHHHLDRHSELPSARGSEERIGTGHSHARGPRRQRDYDLEQEDSFHNRPSIRLPMPDHLKAALVDDWENVTKNQQLVPLPHKAPVETVLDDYLTFERPHREEGSASLDILEETVAGLREYFNKCLGRILLYRFERPQYIEMHELWETDETYKSPIDTYGAEHLCRLLVSLPELIAQTNMDQQSVNRLREELAKLTAWLGKNMAKYFVGEYETPNSEYSEKVRGV
ncbi:Esa1p-associated factor [Sporothrix epigloea]|uniref:Chromatin modification-related protein EAF3 n=1 Tax=Sporothrix epigloea TaxID=1892477 RepID=A0ABP0DYQ3_9PEZI